MADGFKPVYDKNSKVLILGSFPSVKSREVGFYYGNPQNRFWKMLEKTFCEEIGNPTEGKIQFLLRHNIALYDVVKKSNLTGSADATLEKSNNTLANIRCLLPPHTKVEKILCNGKTSYSLLTQKHSQNNIEILDNTPHFLTSSSKKIPIYCLPSTSSANPRFSYEVWLNALSK